MATTTLRLSAARSRSRRLDRLRLVMLAAALPTLLLAVLVAAPLALAAEPTAITVTAPSAPVQKNQGDPLDVTWTTNQAVASGQFSIWVVSPSNGWYVGKIHAATDTVAPGSYADAVALNVPAGTGYRVYVYYRATSGDPWGLYGGSPGTVDVAEVFSAITVTAPSAPVQKNQGDPLDVTWTTNQAVASGQFSIWVVSPSNGWYVGKIHAATDTVAPGSYADAVALNVPAGTGYRVYVYYRATSGDPWGLYGGSPGTVDVAEVFSAITVTAPSAPVQKNQGDPLDVTWTTNQAVASGQFSIWVVSPSNGWYVGKIHAATDTVAPGSYADAVALNVPAGTGYRVYVYYRATSGDPWGLYGGSPGTVDVAAPNSTIAVSDFPDYRVFQRDIGGMSKSVTISGTYSNMDWRRIEARVLRHGTDTVVVDWTTIDPTPGGGTFSGGLTVPQGGWYNIEVRALDSSGSVIASSRGTHKWGVGMIILVIGQSNMSGRGQPPFTAATSDLAVNYSNAGVWEHLADPYDDGSPAGAVDNDNDVIASSNAGGSMIPSIANTLLQTFDFPIAFVPAAKGGSNLHVNASNYGWAYRNPANHLDTSTLYGQSITKARSVGGVELIIMHQGEADLTDGRTEAQYEADFATMIGNYRQDLYAGIPIFICQLGTVGAGTSAGATGIRSAQHDVDNGTNIFMGATAMDLPRIDTWHYSTPALTVIGSRLATAIKYYFGRSDFYRGPSISSASFSDGNRNQVVVTLVHRGGADIRPASGITGFEVFDNGSGVTIQSAARAATDAVRLTLSRSISSGHTVTLRYLYGTTPNVSGLVKDDCPLALPLENTTGSVTVSNM